MADEDSNDYSGPDRRIEPRKDWNQIVAEEAELQKHSDKLIYQKIQSGELSKEKFQGFLDNLRKQATRDSLTGIENRGEFVARLSQEVNQSKTDHKPLSVMALDVDQFKKINDTYGHAAGDQVLVQLGVEVLRTGLLTGGLFYRVGGEEVWGIFPGIKGQELVEAVRATGENLTEAWSRNEGLQARGIGRLTVSIGAGTYQPGKTMVEFLEEVDKKLYLAKRSDSKGEGRQRAKIGLPDGQITEVSFRKN